MAFNQDNFAPVGAISTASPSVYSYITTDDTATVTASDYFEDKSFQLNANDIILSQTSDGFSILEVSSSGTVSSPVTQSRPAIEVVTATGSVSVVTDIEIATGAITRTLPAITAAVKPVTIRNIGAVAITIDTPDSAEIEENTDASLSAGESYTLAPDGTDWWII